MFLHYTLSNQEKSTQFYLYALEINKTGDPFINNADCTNCT